MERPHGKQAVAGNLSVFARLLRVEADGFAWRTERTEKLIQQRKHLLELVSHGVVALAHLFFQLRQAFGQFPVDTEQLPKPDKGPHDLDVDLDSPWASQDAGQHGHPLLGESVRGVTPTAVGCGT